MMIIIKIIMMTLIIFRSDYHYIQPPFPCDLVPKIIIVKYESFENSDQMMIIVKYDSFENSDQMTDDNNCEI